MNPIKLFLNEQELTQDKFGEMVGVSGPSINQWCSETRRPTTYHIVKMAEIMTLTRSAAEKMAGRLAFYFNE